MQRAELIKPGVRACLIGIGGISMSSLAFALSRRGLTVWGSDRAKNEMTERLEAAGIRVVHEHRGDTVEGGRCSHPHCRRARRQS